MCYTENPRVTQSNVKTIPALHVKPASRSGSSHERNLLTCHLKMRQLDALMHISLFYNGKPECWTSNIYYSFRETQIKATVNYTLKTTNLTSTTMAYHSPCQEGYKVSLKGEWLWVAFGGFMPAWQTRGLGFNP